MPEEIKPPVIVEEPESGSRFTYPNISAALSDIEELETEYPDRRFVIRSAEPTIRYE